MERGTRIPSVPAGILIVLCLGGLLALVGEAPPRAGSEPAAEPPPAFEAAKPEVVAERLERLRGLSFEEVPEVMTVSAGEWRRRTKKMAKRGGGSAADRREADAVAEFLKLSGLAPSDFEIEKRPIGARRVGGVTLVKGCQVTRPDDDAIAGHFEFVVT